MNKFAVFVMGPAGTGKSTFCRIFIDYMTSMKKRVHLINLDPAAEVPLDATGAAKNVVDYVTPSMDIQEKYPLKKVMEKYKLGPNGGLMKCINLAADDIDWWEDGISGFTDEILFVDCPGQMEIYLHSTAMKRIVDVFKSNDYSLCSAFLLDAQFLTDKNKFLAGSLNCLCGMLGLELPHVNIVTKMDLVEDGEAALAQLDENEYEYDRDNEAPANPSKVLEQSVKRILEQFNLTDFIPLDITDSESVMSIINVINSVLQNDDLDLNGPDYMDFD